jgi:mRNA interferase MazF
MANGLDQDSVVSCDNVVTVPVSTLGQRIGHLLPDQEPALAEAIRTAFDLV